MAASQLRLLESTDGDLVQKHLAGDDDAFEILFERHFPRLVRTCNRLTHDHLLAEDIAQETLLRALTRLDEFDVKQPMWPWLKTIATRLSYDELRKRGRFISCDAEQQANAQAADDKRWCEDGPPLVQALSQLPGRQREALVFRYIQDQDVAETASSFGLGKAAFEQLLFRARRKLRVEYQRVCRELSGILLIPGIYARGLLTRALFRARSSATFAGYAPEATSVASQVLAVILTVLMMASGNGGLADPPTSDLAHPKTRERDSVTQSEAALFASSEKDDTADKRDEFHEQTRWKRAPFTKEVDGRRTRPSADRIVKDLTSPNHGVDRPEETRITSVALTSSRSRTTAKTMYAAGIAHCRLPSCPPVLFRSEDGGATWKRLKARRLKGALLMLPPQSASNVKRIFAMGPSGLQVSEDGGASFHHAAVSGSSFTTGSAAMSPAFDAGDPTILIGAQNLMRYDDELRTVGPERSTALPGPLEPSFTPAYPIDPRLLVGGLRFDSFQARVVSVVFVCSDGVCTETRLHDHDQVPQIRPAPSFARTGLAYAFTQNKLFVSRNGARKFSVVHTSWDEGLIRDVALVGNAGRLLVAVQGVRPSADDGLYASRNGGLSWRRIPSRLFRDGASTIAVDGDKFIVARGRLGLACSVDHGRTWAPRCPTP